MLPSFDSREFDGTFVNDGGKVSAETIVLDGILPSSASTFAPGNELIIMEGYDYDDFICNVIADEGVVITKASGIILLTVGEDSMEVSEYVDSMKAGTLFKKTPSFEVDMEDVYYGVEYDVLSTVTCDSDGTKTIEYKLSSESEEKYSETEPTKAGANAPAFFLGSPSGGSCPRSSRPFLGSPSGGAVREAD